MAMAAFLSGICVTNAGLGAVHGFAAPLGARFPIPHGVICAALLRPVIAANIAALKAENPEHPTLRRYEIVAEVLTEKNDTTLLDSFLMGLLVELNVPPLSRFGMRESHIPELIPLARQSSSMKYNPIKLSDEALAGILREGIIGYTDAK
jgi:alcohol dehydrogenase class IV